MSRIALVLTAVLGATPAGALDSDLYAELLERHTRAVPDIAGTRVAYAALRVDPDWRKLVEGLARTDPSGLTGDAKLAFWINAYNILAIDLVAANHPIDGIRDIGSLLRPVWKREAGRIGGRGYSLDEIEHRIVRPLDDPRAHGAVVCASLSCPPLARTPYHAETLDAELDANMRRWLADPRKGVAVDEDAGVLRVSSIFKWFAGDFDGAGGVRAFIARYAPEDVRRFIEEHGDRTRLRYLDYDWSLNDLGPAA